MKVLLHLYHALWYPSDKRNMFLDKLSNKSCSSTFNYFSKCPSQTSCTLYTWNLLGLCNGNCWVPVLFQVNKPYLPLASGEYSVGTGVGIVTSFAVMVSKFYIIPLSSSGKGWLSSVLQSWQWHGSSMLCMWATNPSSMAVAWIFLVVKH